MTGTILSGTYTSSVLLDNPGQQNPVTLTGTIAVHGTNQASGSGIYGTSVGAFTIDNQGRIDAYGTTSYGILLAGGGTITNGGAGALGIIQSDETGILLTGTPSAVTNYGTVTGIAGRAVFLQDGGTVDNAAATAALIGGFQGVAIYNAGGVLLNDGTIADTGSAGFAVELYAGIVSNAAPGTIGGVYGIGFVAKTLAGSVVNAGTITGSGRDGIAFAAGGSVSNTGQISGAIAGVLAPYAAISIGNSGLLQGGVAAADLLAGGTVTNLAGGTLAGGFGVSFGQSAAGAGVLSNAGRITATYDAAVFYGGGSLTNSGVLYGQQAGVVGFYAPLTLDNSGSIGGALLGADLADGGSLIQGAGAVLSGGSYGLLLTGPAASVYNAGTVAGAEALAVFTAAMLTNAADGVITGGRYGVYFDAATGSLLNSGTIIGATGVYARGVITGPAGGTISALTIDNQGTIEGTSGTALALFGGDDVLIEAPGAALIGQVIGGQGSELLLAAGAPGSLGALGADLAAFGTVALAPGAVWSGGGALAGGATLEGAGTLMVTASVFDLAGTVNGGSTVAMAAGGILDLAGTAEATATLAFTDATGTLEAPNLPALAAPVAGFRAGDVIWLTNTPLAGLSESYVQGGGAGTLTLKENGTIAAALTLEGSFSAGNFALTANADGGTDLTIPCFAAGTRLAAEGGAVRVEHMRPGMRVLTAAGALRPVVWVGQRVVDIAAHPAPEEVAPVLISAHAFGPSLPARDVLLSPDHAVFWQGGLIPAHLLVNGRTVRRPPVARLRYFHVELESHDILLAEGLPVESFLDTGNKPLFGPVACARPAPGPPCAPLVLAGPRLARARRHLLAQEARRRLAGAYGSAPPEHRNEVVLGH